MDDENKQLNFEYNPDKIYEATIKYVEFKQLLKADYKSKVYLIENNIFEYLSNEYDKYKLEGDLKLELKKENIKNKIISEKIKIIENIEDIESNNLEIITNDILISIGINTKFFSDKDLDLKVLSDTIQQIIFKDKSKLNISFYDNKKHLNIIESPIDYKESNENNKGKKTDSITDIKISTNSINFNQTKNNENHLNEKKVKGYENMNINITSNKKSNENINRNNQNKIENINNDKLSNNEKSEDYNLFDHINKNSLDRNNEFSPNKKNSFCLFSKNSTLIADKSNEKKNFYDNIKDLYEQQKTINNLMNEVINLKNELNNYLIVNKNWFNRLVKIFENQEIYQNELKIIDSFEKITNASNSKISEQIFKRRIKYLTEESLFKLELESEKSLKIKYPKEFILIEKESLNKFNFNFNINFDINSNAYQILFGEKHIFIKDKEDSKNIFICSRDKFFFSVNLILNYNKEEYFKQEIEKFIQNKGGIDHYIKEKNYDIMCDSPQKNINKNGDSYGYALILLNKKGKEKNISNKDNNVDVENQDKILKISIIENYPKNTSIDNFRSLNINPYIYSFLLSLQKIELLKEIIIKNISQNQNNDIFNLLFKFLKANDLTIINEIYKKIYEINSNFKMNFKNLIDFLLKLLHKEFNINKNYLNKNNPKGDFDEKLAYKEFKKNYFESNDSFIQKTFFGIKEIMLTYKCCGLTKYFYESFEYIYIDSELLKKSFNLKDLISKWENKKSNEIHKCLTCNYNTHCLVTQKIIDYPEFLIIVLDNDENNNKYKVRFDNQINTEKFEYNLLNCIISNSSLKNKNYNVIINEENKLYILNNDNNKKEIEKDKIEYPNVFILQKGKENEKFNGVFNSNESYNIADYLNDSSSDDDKKNNKYKIKSNKKTTISLNDRNDLDSSNKSLLRNDTEVLISENLFSDKHISVEEDKNKNNQNNIMMNQMNNFKNNNMSKTSNNISIQNQNNNQINNYNMNNNNMNNYKINNNIKNSNGNNNNQMNNKNNQNMINNHMNNLNNNNIYNNNMSNNIYNNNMNNNMYNNNFINNNNMNIKPMRNMSNSQMNNNNNNMNNINMNNINCINDNMYDNNNYINGNNIINNNNNNDMNNNQKNYNQTNNINNNMKLNENNGQITIYFKLHNGREFHLDTNENYYFGDVIQQLFYQNASLQKEIKIIDFIFKDKRVRMNYTLKQIGIKDKSIINIKHEKFD